jgi:hypothetical protein
MFSNPSTPMPAWAFGLTQKFGSGFSVYFYFGLLLLGTEVLPQN